jgi:PiT family inorganic phosphate transporter
VSWNILTWRLGIPSSSSHTLIGGIVGAAVVAHGIGAILVDGLLKVLIALFISPPLGLLAGYVTMKLLLFIGDNLAFSPKVNTLFRRGQWVTAIWLALSHGTNDAQKTMGIITMTLVASGALTKFAVPLWVIGLSATAIAAGTIFGGWSLIRTLGGGFYKIRPIHSFSTQIASATVILTAALLGGPVSTTQVVGSAIMGVGTAERISKVRWGLTERIVSAWLLTIPISAIIGGLIYHFVISRLP